MNILLAGHVDVVWNPSANVLNMHTKVIQPLHQGSKQRAADTIRVSVITGGEVGSNDH